MKQNRSTTSLHIITALLLLFSLTAVESQAPPVQSTHNFRVTNRRYISHIVHQVRGGEHYVTLLTSHGPSYNNFKSGNHPLYYPCQTPKRCMTILKKLNSYLQTGENIGLRLSGSIIKKLIYYKQQ